ncbi:ABC transporter ATP-binding protein [Helicobacter cinaedi PAGU611]|uniref:Cell division ATP-binding protein FtsE n=1 Tax=Helicobacter cinaedi CCUG 18818 = ATCC BAA-847 TaxID=537971 RepID=A0AAI8QI11_9HELI|nr:methionine ABC transporter ATP-binding protein [Helicobacter cinaedi]AWK62471.1 methionine ABC transporter ATP-binding protein [Helicobacter cinaedi]EFR46011.1 ABC transporter, ATP-binding protein [Helicobacter cinaedi CCUG 18818 = ATCC BAA-847]QOQ90734.1 methionine ABC transporter ATP-binding protein [Helicobacter cinaedi]QOQ96894.1 methionine ABC transporter ATP-binding protein [Helicobacter cinaedi]BAM13035.1 ABC transporter ATP-binding protein [Helicobacter cinaedi PAGU611]
MIELRGINKTYPNGFVALKNIDLSVEKGDIMGIIGYSGAGKSTLIRIINRLEEPTSGEIHIDGVNLLNLKEKALQKERQKIGMIFQHFNLLSAKSVFDNVAFALRIAKWKSSEIKPRVNELLELVGLSDRAGFYPSQLSGGQKQRVAIARALANHPKVLLCDEATSALDTKTTKSILSLLRDIQQKLGLSVVLITHQIEVVREICNKMCVVSGGEIVERGSVDSVFASPKHAITKELISFLPQDEGRVISHLQNKDNVYKIIFTGPYAQSPLISQMIRKFDIDVNILSGNIDELATGEVGHLVLKFIAQDSLLQDSLKWLQEQGVSVESLAHHSAYIDSSKGE